jgi:hypothetical protein
MELGSRYTSTGSGPVRTVAGADPAPDQPEDTLPLRALEPARPAAAPNSPKPVRIDAPLIDETAPDEPVAVVAVGPAGGGRTEVIAALLGVGESALRVPQGSFLLVRHGQDVTSAAYVPGYQEPHVYSNEPASAGPARPPRRVELTFPDPLLRRFDLVDAPDTASLGLAGSRVLLDVVERAGALLFVISAEQALAVADLDLLAQVAQGGAAIFFVVTPGEGGWPGAGEAESGVTGESETHAEVGAGAGWVLVPADADPAQVILDAHRAALLAAVPALVDAPWFALDPADGDTVQLRGELIDWASGEELRRAAAHPPVAPGAARTVPVAAAAHDSDWEGWLDREVRTRAHQLRQHLALELAHIHLRCVQGLVFGAGCPGLPAALDRELHALSLRAVAESDLGVARILTETLTRVFGDAPDEAVRRRVTTAVRWGFGEHRSGRDLHRVLLVTSTAGVASVTGAGAVAALAVYPRKLGGVLLPPIGVGLSSVCYQHWRNPANADTPKARCWLQRTLREVELELARELTRRFEAVQVSLTTMLTDAVDHGILLA